VGFLLQSMLYVFCWLLFLKIMNILVFPMQQSIFSVKNASASTQNHILGGTNDNHKDNQQQKHELHKSGFSAFWQR
jgi:hypothetical protein